MVDPHGTRLSLLARVRDPADTAAWDSFEHRYRDLVHHYAVARGLQFCDAEDVCQIVFLRLARYLRDFSYSPGRGRFRSYLGAIVRNVIADQSRCPPGRPNSVDAFEGRLNEMPDPGADEPDPQWESEWVSHHCRLALSGVRRSCDARSVEVFEALLAGETTESAAARFEMSRDAVIKIRQRIRARMQELIREQVSDEDAE